MIKRGKKSICLLLSMVIALSWVLCACGSQSAPTQTTAPTEAITTSVPVEATETVPAETEPVFCTVEGVTYDSRLGAPILNEAAAELAQAGDIAAAVEQITNVGDAIYYLSALPRFDQPYDACKLFGDLLEQDYDEIGLIVLSASDNGYALAYIKHDGIFYPFDPFRVSEGSAPWDLARGGEADLEVLGEKMMTTCPYVWDGQSMISYETKRLSSAELCNANGILYASKLGKPVLGAGVAKYNVEAAAEQITNVGDAIYYMKACQHSQSPYDISRVFAQLLENDYEEIGYIWLVPWVTAEYYAFVYIQHDGMFYPFDPYRMAKGMEILEIAQEPEADLNVLSEKLMSAYPVHPNGDPITFCVSEPVYSSRVCTVNGIRYASKLGEPVLGDAAAKLAWEGDVAVAAEQISNVGDAIHYIMSAKVINMPLETCQLFTYLLTDDYNEVGLITLTQPDNGYTYAYIQQDGIYYYFDPFRFKKDDHYYPCAPKACDDLDTLGKNLMTRFPQTSADKPMTSYRTQALSSNLPTKENAAVRYLTTCQYTMEQIEQWVDEDLTAEQWAEIIKVPADAVQMLRARGYYFEDNQPGSQSIVDETTGAEWSNTWSAQDSLHLNCGNCEGISNVINFLLADDFEEQGYVQFNTNGGGHIFNYFVYDGAYVMCDFSDIITLRHLPLYPNTRDYIVYACGNMQTFGQWYRTKGFFAERFEQVDGEDYLYHLWSYPWEGTSLPKGWDTQSKVTENNNHVWDLFPEKYKALFVILFEREGTPIRFMSFPSPDATQSQ